MKIRHTILVLLLVAMMAVFANAAVAQQSAKADRPGGEAAETNGNREFQNRLALHEDWLAAVGDVPMIAISGAEFLPEPMRNDPRRAVLRGRTLNRIDGSGAQLRMADFEGSRFKGGTLSGADLSFSVLARVKMSGVNLSGAKLRNVNATASRMANTDLSGADLTQANLSGADLSGAKLNGAMLAGATLSGANLQGARLSGADLSGADLTNADLSGADLFAANLRGANLKNGDLTSANLSGADLREADLFNARLSNAVLMNTNLQRAILLGAELDGTRLFANDIRQTSLKNVDLTGVIFERAADWKATSVKEMKNMALARNLGRMTFYTDPEPLEELRRMFQKEGYRGQVLDITYALRRGLRKQACDTGGIMDQFACVLEFVFVEWPVEYGAAPFRPLKLIVGLVLFFGMVNLLPLMYPSTRFGQVWKITPMGRFFRESDTQVEKLLHLTFFAALPKAFWFSFITAFSIGSKIFRVEDLFIQCQTEEYYLKATGWFQAISGLQSVASSYLLALSILIFFEKIAF